jgi:hypothetical protein
MIRQPNTQTYVKVFYNISLPEISIINVHENPYYNNYNPAIKLIESNNNNNLIYGNRKE